MTLEEIHDYLLTKHNNAVAELARIGVDKIKYREHLLHNKTKLNEMLDHLETLLDRGIA